MAEITVIIPAYNAGKTIGRTLRSIQASTVPVKIVVVNDGSTDNTVEEAQKYNVHVIDQANTGAYQARVNGLCAVESPFVGFVDADDEVEPCMFEKMLRKAKSEDLDVVKCRYIGEEERFDSLKDYVSRAVISGETSSLVWDKIYRTACITMKFVETDRVTNFDDVLLCLQIFTQVKRMGFVEEELYRYNEVGSSAVHKFNWRKVKDYLETCRLRMKLVKTYGIHPLGYVNVRWMIKNARNMCAFAVRSFLRSR